MYDPYVLVYSAVFRGYSQRRDFYPSTCSLAILQDTSTKPFQVVVSNTLNNWKADSASLGLASSKCCSYFSISRAKEAAEPSIRQRWIRALPRLLMEHQRWNATLNAQKCHIKGSEACFPVTGSRRRVEEKQQTSKNSQLGASPEFASRMGRQRKHAGGTNAACQTGLQRTAADTTSRHLLPVVKYHKSLRRKENRVLHFLEHLLNCQVF